jgi:hypothetical protein
MKSGKTARTKSNTCLGCGKLTDAATVVGEEGKIKPKPDDVTVCLYCGHLMAFDQELRFRALTDNEIKEFAGDDRIVAINQARK